MKVRPKKRFGQHFLVDQQIAKRIVASLELNDGDRVLEIGPGTGVLTQFLVDQTANLQLVELDRESVEYLHRVYPSLQEKLIEGDFLKLPLPAVDVIIGNFPYNISSQIFFKVLEHRDQIHQVVCMIQKEVADRIASRHGNKVYGILSVLLQAYYDVEFLFKVSPGSFNPPPKVVSGVVRLKRNSTKSLACDEKLFFKVVKQGFNNRRKTLRNALKNLNLPPAITSMELLSKRAEQLTVNDFVHLTSLIETTLGNNNI